MAGADVGQGRSEKGELWASLPRILPRKWPVWNFSVESTHLLSLAKQTGAVAIPGVAAIGSFL